MPDFDVSVPHIARIYDYWLGGKDNISQVVSVIPHSIPTGAIQLRQRNNSKTGSIGVRDLFGTYMGAYVRFLVGCS